MNWTIPQKKVWYIREKKLGDYKKEKLYKRRTKYYTKKKLHGKRLYKKRDYIKGGLDGEELYKEKPQKVNYTIQRADYMEKDYIQKITPYKGRII